MNWPTLCPTTGFASYSPTLALWAASSVPISCATRPTTISVRSPRSWEPACLMPSPYPCCSTTRSIWDKCARPFTTTTTVRRELTAPQLLVWSTAGNSKDWPKLSARYSSRTRAKRFLTSRTCSISIAAIRISVTTCATTWPSSLRPTSCNNSTKRQALNETILYQAATPAILGALLVRTHCGLSCYVLGTGDSTLDRYYTTLDWYQQVYPIDY